MNYDSHSSIKESYHFKEVASMTGVKPYVLRFWETEFEQIRPLLTEGGQKMYRPDDLEVIKKIKILLFDEKMTIPQAKAFLDKDEIELMQESVAVEEKSLDLKEALEVIISSGKQDDTSAFKSDSAYKLLNEKNAESKISEKVLTAKIFNEKEILSMIQAKKKLTGVLAKIESIIEVHSW